MLSTLIAEQSMKTVFSTGVIVTSNFLNSINSQQLRFIHPINTPLNSMNDGEYWQLSLSDFDTSSLDQRYVTLATAQNISGSKNFSVPVSCTQLPTDGFHLVRLLDLNASIASLSGNYVSLTGDQTVAGVKTFSDGLKTPIVPTGSEDVVNLAATSDFVTKSTAQTITGNKTFTGGLKTSTTATASDDVVNLASTSDFVTKSTAQTITGNKTFTGQVIVREPQAGNEALNLRDAANRFQNTARVVIRITTGSITQSVTHQFLDLFDTSKYTIEYNKAAITSGLVLQPHGNDGVFSVENRYGEVYDDPIVLAKFDTSLVGGTGYTYLSYNREIDYEIGVSNASTDPANLRWLELDSDDLIRRTIGGNIRTTLASSNVSLNSGGTPLRALSWVQMLESPVNVFNPRSGTFNITGAKEIIFSF
jgi:hypothetical protein